jgi:ribosome maturation factor RimP
VVPNERAMKLIEPLFADSGFQLWDVEEGPGVVRVLIDRAGGIDLDSLAGWTDLISQALDSQPAVAPKGSYQLEVSSPGVERSLRRPEHFASRIGAVVSVKTALAVAGARRIRGVLAAADEVGLTLAAEAGESFGGSSRIELPYDQVQQARTVLDWGPAPKPGKQHRVAHRSGAELPASLTATSKDTPS